MKRRPEPGSVEATTGPLIVVASLVLVLFAGAVCQELLPERRVSAWIIVGAAVGMSFCVLYLVGGHRWANYFAFPLLFFIIAVPWPSRLEVPVIETLSKANAVISTGIANLMGIPAIRVGTLIQTGTGLVGIDDACSGIRSFQSSVMIALFLGELFSYGFFRRILFLGSGVMLAFLCNVVRTTYLVRVCDQQGNDAVSANHDPAGFTILAVTLAGLLVLAWLFRPRRRKSASKGTEPEGGTGNSERISSQMRYAK